MYPVFLVCLFFAVSCFLSVSSLGWSSVNCLPVVMSLSHTRMSLWGDDRKPSDENLTRSYRNPRHALPI